MNENIDLCEMLKDCPIGTEFYSSVFGRVKFKEINYITILVSAFGNITKRFDSEGRYIYGEYCDGECTLFPSKEQRDWSKWVCPKPKKPRFDPKTLQPFDKILVSGGEAGRWFIELFGFFDKDNKTVCSSGTKVLCAIPYNNDTKHLIGTTEEAPEYYRYWAE